MLKGPEFAHFCVRCTVVPEAIFSFFDPLMSGKTRLDRWVRWVGYGLFLGLFLFELLNLLGILEVRLDYTWRGRVISTAFVFLVAYGVDSVMRRWVGKRLSGWVWVAMILLILVDFCGDVFRLYLSVGWYDRFAHALSGPLVAGSLFLVFRDLAAGLAWRVPRGVVGLLAFGTHETFSVLYEMQEYLEDVLFGSRRSGGGMDTADDLTLSFVGGALTIVACVLVDALRADRSRKRPTS